MTDLAIIQGRLGITIPEADERWAAINVPPAELRRCRLLLRLMAEIHAADDKTRACRAIAARLRGQDEFAGVRGLSWSRLRARYYDLQRTNDWRVCLNKSRVKGANGSAKLPAEFVQFWRALCERNQRVSTQARRDLLHIWRHHHDLSGKPYAKIPGYDTWPEPEPRTGIPAGWTENLYRYNPDKYELAATRQGRKHAANIGIKLRTTRVGLHVGEIYEFDDHEFDLLVNFPGVLQAMRPQGFTGIDALSDNPFLQSFKPTLLDDNGRKKVLNERDFMWFIVATLTTIGHRTDAIGTTLRVEHGTAAIRPDFEQRILDATAGHVTVARSGKFRKGSHAGQFDAQSTGNFRFKRLIEQYWRSINDRLASLPGQVGKDRLSAPEQNYGLQSYNAKLLKAIGALEPERAAEIEFPVLHYWEFVRRAMAANDAIATDPEHNCQGWEKLGFVRQVQDPFGRIRAQKLTRRQVFDGLRRAEMQSGKFALLPDYKLPQLVGQHNALRAGDPLTVRNGEFEFEDRDIDPDPLRYLALGQDGQRLREGEKYIAYVNPFKPDSLVATDAAGRIVAICQQVAESCINDDHAIKRQLGAQNKWQAAALDPIRDRHAEETERLKFIREHNAAIIAGKKPVTQAEKDAATYQRKHGKAASVTIFEDAPVILDESTPDTTTQSADDLLASIL